MWPWGHLAGAYLLYSLVVRYRDEGPPRALAVVAVALGSQAPDRIEKPLAWTVGVRPGGRTPGHSLLVAAPVRWAIHRVALRLERRETATAFALGYGSHLVTELPPVVLAGEFKDATYLGWPLHATERV